MKKLLTLVLCFALTIVSLASWMTNPAEPQYRGRNLAAWLDDLDTLDREQWEQAAEAVRSIGTDSLPLLRQRLRAKDSFLKRKLIESVGTCPILPLVSAEARYDISLYACQILGPVAEPLTSDIIPFLGHNHRAAGVKALVAIGEGAVDPLVRSLACPSLSARAGAAVALGTLVARPESTVPALIQHLDDSLHETRMTAAWALGRFGIRAASAIEPLCVLTNDPAYNVREQARLALTRIGSGAPVRNGLQQNQPCFNIYQLDSCVRR
ncbi:MAG: HEAT repeat domain-containing protein [Verrucomicrobia bacterium]|nr:HEAT repeat domain-containing protein [Verrucomicrobiota bacterium]